MSKVKNGGLGKGLDAIFMDNLGEDGAVGEETAASRSVVELKLTELEPRSDQPRRYFDSAELCSLSESVAANGIIQPLIVRRGENGFYSIIAGERRWRAAKMAGLQTAPCIVIEADELKTAQLALIENVQRADLSPVEEANAYLSLLENYGMTHEELSRSVGKSRSAVTNAIRLLDLPEKTLDSLTKGYISAGHARALLPLGDSELIDSIAEKVRYEDMSVRDTEALVKTILKKLEKGGDAEQDAEDSGENAPIDVDYGSEVAQKLTEKLGRKVKIVEGKRAKRLTIDFSDNDDLEELIRLLTGESGILG